MVVADQATSIELDLTNTLIHKYHITHELGRGGMGIVYAASRADKTFEQDGSLTASLYLDPGVNTITVVATDGLNNSLTENYFCASSWGSRWGN